MTLKLQLDIMTTIFILFSVEYKIKEPLFSESLFSVPYINKYLMLNDVRLRAPVSANCVVNATANNAS